MTADQDSFELIIDAAWLLPVAPQNQALADYSVAVRDGRIAAIAATAHTGAWQASTRVALPHHALLPGFVNAHGHAAMSLLRGYADDLSLQRWLHERIWPAEGRHISVEFVHDGASLALLEMLRAGITTSSDMYFYPEQTAAIAEHFGMRMQLAFPVMDVATTWARSADEAIAKGLRLHDHCKHSALVSAAFGPHSIYAVGQATLERIAILAAELDLPVQMHLHETETEVRQQLGDTGQRPLARVAELGLLGPRTQCVHMAWVDDSDIALLQLHNASVVHCPRSNLKLAAGRCPTAQLLQAGITVALGTDGAASNNRLNLLDEMQAAAQLARLQAGDPSALPAGTLLELATLSGARALGMEADIGSLEAGKFADMVAIDLAAPETQPVYDPIASVVYAASAAQVTHVWVGGRALMSQRHAAHIDSAAIIARARQWQQRIATA